MARPRLANPRSVLIALRVTPRVRYGLELLARRQRCSMSEIVLQAVDARLDDVRVGLRLVARGERQPTLVLDRVWSPHEWERISRVALFYPELLQDNERYLWRRIQESAAYWKRSPVPKHPAVDDLNWDVVARDWPKLKRQSGMG